MKGRLLATTEHILCIYGEQGSVGYDAVSNWADTQPIELTMISVGDTVRAEQFDEANDVLGMTLGGDGTFLEGVREFSKHEIPFLAINEGSLSFLARVSPESVDAALDEIVRGRATIAQRQQVRVETGDLSETGVNDIMIQPLPPEDPVERKIAALDTFVDGEYVGEYVGSGLAVSTPTGSTGLSLSANGPIHYPSNNTSLQIVPLHTHQTGVRPLVVGNDSTIVVQPQDEVRLLVDGGRAATTISPGEDIVLTGADKRADIVRTSYDDQFFSAMSDKLGWSIRDNADDKEIPDTYTQKDEYNDFNERAMDIACQAAKSAGRPLREVHGSVEHITEKQSASDIVTEADYRAQRVIKSVIQNEFPDHDIYSEEDWPDEQESGSEYAWIVDPLDGTGNYTHGNPNYSVSIAMVTEGQPVVAVVYQPETDELFHAIDGQGSYKDGDPISVSSSDELKRSMMLSGYDPDGEFIQAFYQETRGVRSIGSAALNMCYIASGAADAVWEYDTYAWDVAAGLLILREAGGTVTGMDNQPYLLDLATDTELPMIASNGRIHERVCGHIGHCNIR